MKPEMRERLWSAIGEYGCALTDCRRDNAVKFFESLIAQIERDAVEGETGHEISWADLNREYRSACERIATLTERVKELEARESGAVNTDPTECKDFMPRGMNVRVKCDGNPWSVCDTCARKN